jgi:hypothetical protein
MSSLRAMRPAAVSSSGDIAHSGLPSARRNAIHCASFSIAMAHH